MLVQAVAHTRIYAAQGAQMLGASNRVRRWRRHIILANSLCRGILKIAQHGMAWLLVVTGTAGGRRTYPRRAHHRYSHHPIARPGWDKRRFMLLTHEGLHGRLRSFSGRFRLWVRLYRSELDCSRSLSI